MNNLKKIILPYYLVAYKIYTLYLKPYKYDKDRYLDSFVSSKEKVKDVTLQKAKEVIYIFWTGNNEIPENRRKSIQSIIEKANIKVKLITPNNLNEYVLKSYPLHPGFDYLSLVHKSDYLRCYFMLHHGGGYSDIKPCLNSWKELFDQLNNSDKWCLGKREKYPGGIADIGGNIGKDCRTYHNNIITNGGFIYKPNSPITQEWIDELHERMDFYFDELVKFPGDIFGTGSYPIPWSYLLGQIMAPLILKYHQNVLRIDLPLYDLKNYR